MTLLFADVVGFTRASACLAPKEIIATLASLIEAFDALHAVHGVAKVITSGDSYFSIVGSQHAPGHAAATLLPPAEQARIAAGLALAMVATAQSHAWPDGSPMHVRVGLHCGAVTTGFVGGLTPRWSVYGAAVNTAARMEKHAGPSRVLCTGDFVAALVPLVRVGAFATALRLPPVFCKGIGELESFWLSAAAEGVAEAAVTDARGGSPSQPCPSSARVPRRRTTSCSQR